MRTLTSTPASEAGTQREVSSPEISSPEDVRSKCVAIHAALIGHEPRIDQFPLPPAPPTVSERLKREAHRLSQLAFDFLGGFTRDTRVATETERRFEEAAAKFAQRQKRAGSQRKVA